MGGILYVVATPIGNLEDLTYRAARLLGEVDLIACEDTRHTLKLLAHYGIARPTISYHEHNEASRAGELIEKLRAGLKIALVSDAGTPLVSDPGYRLVSQAVEAGIPVVPLPGASALLPALAASGLPTDAFHFGGFLPAKAGRRRKFLESLKSVPGTLVFYEAPHRILETLDDVARILGDRSVVVAREMTKMHEEFLRGTAAGIRTLLAGRPVIKGEITLLVGHGAGVEPDATSVSEAVRARIAEGLDRMAAIKAVARERRLSKRQVYKSVQNA